MASGLDRGYFFDVTAEMTSNYSKEGLEDSSIEEETTDNGNVTYGPDGQVRIRVFRGHRDAVSSCQLFDNDTKVLSSSHDKTILLWGSESNTRLQEYKNGHTARITKARVNRECSRIVSTGWDKKVILWDLETGNILWTGCHNGITTCCNFSHDGKLVATASDLDPSVKIWDTHNGELVTEVKDLHSSTITSCQFSSHDDRFVTTSMDKTSKFYDLKSQCATISLSNGIGNVISDASLTKDERKLATVSWDRSVKVWDVSTGMYRQYGASSIEKAHEGSISSCDTSPDGLMLVTGGYDNQVCVWDIDNMVQKLRLQGHSDWVEDVSFSKDQNWCLSCSRDKTLRLWNVENTEKIPMVFEKRKAIGLRVITCASCGKPFSISESDSGDNITDCVFCRLQATEKDFVYTAESPDPPSGA